MALMQCSYRADLCKTFNLVWVSGSIFMVLLGNKYSGKELKVCS